MTKFITVAAAALSALPLISAAGPGYAEVRNNCDFPAYVWTVGSQTSNVVTLQKGGVFPEQFIRDPQTGGKALKVATTSDGLYTGAPLTTFAYTLDGTAAPWTVWYDLSGDAFTGHKLVLSSSEAGCEPVVWPQGTSPGGSQTKACTSTRQDVTLTLCAP